MISSKHNEISRFDFSKFSLNGTSQLMRTKMLEAKYILEGLALFGEWTVIYGAPGAGKTLITLSMLIESIKKDVINPADVFYINADDTFNGFVEKLELAEKYGFHMIQPGSNGFDSNKLMDYLQGMISSENAKGKIIFLDTLKKFTNLMDKSIATEFGKVVRDFVTHGGSVVALAHVNKHKNEFGKSIHSGTSDIKDDSDCGYVMDVTDSKGALKTVEFISGKSRGGKSYPLTVQYSNESGGNYLDLLHSVRVLSDHQVELQRHVDSVENLIKGNMFVIAPIESIITSGVNQKTELVEAVHKTSGASKAKILKVLEQHSGEDWDSGHRWNYSVSGKNVHTYELIGSINQEIGGSH